METKHHLREETIEKVQDLIQINIDSQKGFAEAADKVQDKQIASLFRQLGGERQTNTTELQQIVNLPSCDRGRLCAGRSRFFRARCGCSVISAGDDSRRGRLWACCSASDRNEEERAALSRG